MRITTVMENSSLIVSMRISNKETFEDKYTIDYENNQVRISWKDGNDSEICTYSLNENGFCNLCNISH